MKAIIGVGLALLTLTIPGRAQIKTSPILDKVIAEYVAAFNAKDAVKIASFYADDGVVMSADVPIIRGRANIEVSFKQQFEHDNSVLDLKASESEIVGAFGYAAGPFTFRAPGTQTYAGKSVTIFKPAGNDWKIAYDMQNVDRLPIN